MSLTESLIIASVVSGFLPVLASLYNYRNLDKVLKIAAIYFLASVASDLVMQVMKNSGQPNNWPVIHIYIALSMLSLGAMYYYAFFNLLFKKTIFWVTLLAFVSICVDSIFIEGIWDYPSISNTILNIVMLCFSLIYFYQLLNRQEFVHIEKQALFWINAGILFYFSINIFLFMLFKRMLNEHQESFYIINDITNIIANILFTIGLLCKPQKVT